MARKRSQASVSSCARRRFDDAGAVPALRRLSGRLEACAHPIQLVARPAVEAGRIGAVAVELDHLISRDARLLLQAVDVLRDDGRHLPRGDERGQCEMAAARARAAIEVVHRELAPPRLAARLGAADIGLERDRLVLEPGASGRAEIRHAALGRDAGAGEARDHARAADEHDEILDLVGKGGARRARGHRRSMGERGAKPKGRDRR